MDRGNTFNLVSHIAIAHELCAHFPHLLGYFQIFYYDHSSLLLPVTPKLVSGSWIAITAESQQVTANQEQYIVGDCTALFKWPEESHKKKIIIILLAH